jgi:hypothetical protein
MSGIGALLSELGVIGWQCGWVAVWRGSGWVAVRGDFGFATATHCHCHCHWLFVMTDQYTKLTVSKTHTHTH